MRKKWVQLFRGSGEGSFEGSIEGSFEGSQSVDIMGNYNFLEVHRFPKVVIFFSAEI